MNVLENSIFTRAVFHGDEHRLLLEKVWSKDSKGLGNVAICMSNAGVMPSIYHMDYTTLFCCNSLSSLGYNSCSIVNLFSRMTNKLSLSGDLSDLICPENEEQILQVSKECDVFIWAVGSITTTYKKVIPYQDSIFRLLAPIADKMRIIENSVGQQGLHPLHPSLRNKPWKLVPFVLPALTPNDKTDAEADGNKDTATVKPKKNDKKGSPLAS